MLKIESAENSIAIIHDEIRRTPDARYEHRLHAVLLVAQGMSCIRVGELLGDSSRAVENWVKSFNKLGLQGLYDLPIQGRPSRISDILLQEINEVLHNTPEKQGLNYAIWDGKSLSYWLQNCKGVSLGTRQCQRIFRQLNFSFRKPRPKNAKGDPEKQAAYKKTL